jgi:hypothetical protein
LGSLTIASIMGDSLNLGGLDSIEMIFLGEFDFDETKLPVKITPEQKINLIKAIPYLGLSHYHLYADKYNAQERLLYCENSIREGLDMFGHSAKRDQAEIILIKILTEQDLDEREIS